VAPNATNPVGMAHNFTVTVEKDEGSGWVPADGVSVNASLTGVGSIISSGPYTTDGSGQVIVTVNSSVPGIANLHASATVNVTGVDIDVDTDGYGAFVVDNEKTWVDARISIAPNATNPVGMAHNFTVTVEMTDDGTTWNPVAGVNVTATLAGGSVGSIISSPPYTTDGSGQVTVTVNSSVPGTAHVNASANVPVDSSGFINVATDGYGAWIVDNEKIWAGARISIAPNATNPVGMAHNFTVTVEKTDDGTTWNPVAGVNVTATLAGGSVGSIISSPPYTTDSSGQVIVTVNSSAAGTAYVHASASVPVDSSGFINVATDGYGAWIVDNEKTWVDARISIGSNATNPVGMAHNFTVTVEKTDDGTTWNPVAGVNVTATLAGGSVGSIISSPPYTTDGSGQVTVTVNSSVPGVAHVDASASVPVDSSGFINVATDGYGAWTVDNEKTWVDARISIGSNATNPVGVAHNFTVTVEKTDDGTTWDPVAGVNVTASLAGGSVGSIISSPPYTTDSSGQVTVTVNSSVPGVAHVDASASVPVDSSGFIDVATDGYGAWIVDNEKIWAGARISIAPNATNPVGMAHNFTVTVEKTDDGTTWDPVVGINVTASLAGGSVGSIISSPPYTTDGSGQVTVTVNSSVTGTAHVDASANVPVDSGFITVATDGYGAFVVDNEKDWVDARISIEESDTNPVGTPHTFNVTVEMNDGGGWDPAVGVNVTPWLLGGSVGSIVSSPPYITDGSGMVFVTVNSSVPGTATVHASATVNVGGIDIAVATDGYGAYYVSNVKEWISLGLATRTWGFWKTHLDLVQYMYDQGIWSSIDMGTWNNASNTPQAHIVDSMCRYMGLMFSDQSKNSNHKDGRYDIDMARIHAAHQALAAIMNALMPGGAPLPGGMTLGDIATALSSNDITVLRNLGSVLGDYNESGDGVALDPILEAHKGNADPNGGKAIGAPCEPYFNTPPAPKGKGHK
jgi:hypothetical protein